MALTPYIAHGAKNFHTTGVFLDIDFVRKQEADESLLPHREWDKSLRAVGQIQLREDVPR